jgi:hypothetical protein
LSLLTRPSFPQSTRAASPTPSLRNDYFVELQNKLFDHEPSNRAVQGPPID